MLHASKANSARAEFLSLSVADVGLDGPAWWGVWAARSVQGHLVSTNHMLVPRPATHKCKAWKCPQALANVPEDASKVTPPLQNLCSTGQGLHLPRGWQDGPNRREMKAQYLPRPGPTSLSWWGGESAPCGHPGSLLATRWDKAGPVLQGRAHMPAPGTTPSFALLGMAM